eukprot:scaffold114824_cov34-Prasinocladus_malaysianus.AAC.1
MIDASQVVLSPAAVAMKLMGSCQNLPTSSLMRFPKVQCLLAQGDPVVSCSTGKPKVWQIVGVEYYCTSTKTGGRPVGLLGTLPEPPRATSYYMRVGCCHNFHALVAPGSHKALAQGLSWPDRRLYGDFRTDREEGAAEADPHNVASGSGRVPGRPTGRTPVLVPVQ